MTITSRPSRPSTVQKNRQVQLGRAVFSSVLRRRVAASQPQLYTNVHRNSHAPCFTDSLVISAAATRTQTPAAPICQSSSLADRHCHATLGDYLKSTLLSMEKRHSPPNMWPLDSSEHEQHGVSRSTTSTSASSKRSFASRSEKRERLRESVNEGLGIQMREMDSPVSPDSVYRLKGGLYSPLSPRPPISRSGTVSTSMSRARTDPMTQRLIERRATQASRWTIHWRTPSMMVASFLVGIALAVGQHLLYLSLHHKVEDDEGKKVKYVLYGRALAYFSKVAFGMCCILVYRQRIWQVSRVYSGFFRSEGKTSYCYPKQKESFILLAAEIPAKYHLPTFLRYILTIYLPGL
jgi:hypothetical protein